MSAQRRLIAGRFILPLNRPLVMGIVNVTQDSFADGGRYFAFDDAHAHARRLIAEGADMIDLGGESTRPGAVPVSEAEELRRVIPLLEALRDAGIPLSVDTQKPGVMRAALEAGADLINDVRALTEPGAIEVVARSGAAVCLMHMQGEPRTMQNAPDYHDVVAEVRQFLQARTRACMDGGIGLERILVDPGFGFGKTVRHNLELLRRLHLLTDLGCPVLAGLSRKSSLGALTGRTRPDDRVYASVAAALIAVEHGAAVVRVHDVAATVDAMKIWQAVNAAGDETPQA